MMAMASRLVAAILPLVFIACSSGGTNRAAGDAGVAATSDGAGGDSAGSQDAASPLGNDSGGSSGASSGGSDSGASSGADASSDGGASGVWRPFSDTSPWNTTIPVSPALDPGSSTMIADFSSIAGQTTFWVNIQQYSVPVYWVDSTMTPTQTVSSSLGGTGFRMGAANDSVAAGHGPAPIPSGAMPAAGTDKHLAVIDRTAHTEWGFWNADDSTGSWTAGEASTMDLSGDGVRPPTTSAPWWAGQGPRACGYALIAGLITIDEIKAGQIRHALVLAYPHIESRYFTPPASSAQGTTSQAISTRGIPCGGHVQLDPTLDITSLGLSPAGLAIARALSNTARSSATSREPSVFTPTHHPQRRRTGAPAR
jgi:hypothetical protein